MKKNYLITTGGSGGHVIPATILHDHLSKEANVHLSIDRRGLKFLDKTNYQYEIIDTPRLSNIFFLPLNLIIISFLTLKSFNLLKNKKIDKVFCTGGYMSLPLILAAKLLKLEIFLIEPNQVLGRANRYFLSSCKKIFCYNKQVKNFPESFKDKIIIINPLVKKDIYELNSPNTFNNELNLLIVGGSQGANIFDNNIKNLIINISKKISIKVIQQTNEKNISSLNNFYKKNKVENEIFSFNKNFADYFKKTNLCITRAGASTLAELSIMNIPFIAVPLPKSKDDHQFENANLYKTNDCCWLIEQNNLEKKIGEILDEILNNKSSFLKKKENLKKLNYQNTWINVNQKILKVINEN